MINEILLWMAELIGLKKPSTGPNENGHRVMALMLIVATIPTAIIGFLFNDLFEKMFSSTYIIGFSLLITGTLLWISNRMVKGRKQPKDIYYKRCCNHRITSGMAITPWLISIGYYYFCRNA